MSKYMSITVTRFEDHPELNRALVYYYDEAVKLEFTHTVSLEEGMKELRRLEKLLGRSATLTINRHNRFICYKELHGYIDRE